MARLPEEIFATSRVRRFLEEHPEGWSAKDRDDLLAKLRPFYPDLDEAAFKAAMLDRHLATGKPLPPEDTGIGEVAEAPVAGPDPATAPPPAPLEDPPPPGDGPRRSRHRWLAVVAVVLLLALAALGTWLRYFRNPG